MSGDNDRAESLVQEISQEDRATDLPEELPLLQLTFTPQKKKDCGCFPILKRAQ